MDDLQFFMSLLAEATLPLQNEERPQFQVCSNFEGWWPLESEARSYGRQSVRTYGNQPSSGWTPRAKRGGGRRGNNVQRFTDF
jgi:hypothetical protein